MLTKEEADKVGSALIQVFGTLALLYKLHGVSSEAHPEPIKVPFHNNVDEAYEVLTPEVRELLVRAIYGK